MLCYVMFCYVMLCYVILQHATGRMDNPGVSGMALLHNSDPGKF